MLKKISELWEKFFPQIRPSAAEIQTLLDSGAPCMLPEGTTWEPILERLKIVDLRPGDMLTDRGYLAIKTQIEKLKVKTMILEAGLTLRAVLRDEAEQKEAKK